MGTEPRENSSRTIWIVLGIIVALLMGCMLGSCSGGFIGYRLGQRRASMNRWSLSMQRVLPWQQNAPTWEELLYEDEAGFIVVEVLPDGPADQAGVRVGDVIVALDSMPVGGQKLSSMLSSYQPGDVVVLTIDRNGRYLGIEVRTGQAGVNCCQAWLGIRVSSIDSHTRD